MKRRREDLQKKAENGFENFGDYMQAKVTKLEEQFLDIQVSDDSTIHFLVIHSFLPNIFSIYYYLFSSIIIFQIQICSMT